MKAQLFIKFFFVLPLILFADYLLMLLIGCATCLFGFGTEIYCNSYCTMGKIILFASAVFFGYLVYRDVKKYKSQNGTTEIIS